MNRIRFIFGRDLLFLLMSNDSVRCRSPQALCFQVVAFNVFGADTLKSQVTPTHQICSPFQAFPLHYSLLYPRLSAFSPLHIRNCVMPLQDDSFNHFNRLPKMASLAVQHGYTKRSREVRHVKGGTNVDYACLQDSLKSK
jgi:hypothetical protein